MKKKVFYGMSLLIIGVLATSVVFAQGGEIGKRFAVETSSPYSFLLNSSKNALDETEISAKKASIVSESGGASVTLSLNEVSLSSGWGTLSTGGYIKNDDIIHGLLEFNATFSGSLALYWSSLPINPLSLDGLSNTIITSESSYTFGDDHPNYFLLMNSGDSSTVITSLSFVYDCSLHPIEFGHYPQTVVEDTTLISTLDTLTPDSDGYVENEGKKYLKTQGSGNSVYSVDSTYYFEVEPIMWDVSPDLPLLSQKILDAGIFYTDVYASGRVPRKLDGLTIHPQNYEFSSLRAFLNGLDGTAYGVDDFSGSGKNFLDMAFSSEEQERIALTEVDNSSTSQYFTWRSTNDKIFLYSSQEASQAKNYFSTGESTLSTYKKYPTDYAVFKGVGYSAPNGGGDWWLRSASIFSYTYAMGVSTSKDTINNAYLANTVLGLAPALNVTL